MFAIRKTKPEKGNKFYITLGAGGWNNCIKGKPTDKDCDVLANCVGYACGRFNEIIGTMKYPNLNCNAENFIEKAKRYGLEVVDYPVLGGIMVMRKGQAGNSSDGAGHVFIVEDIYDKNHIYTSESGYNSKAFWNSHRYNTNGRWGHASTYAFRGCIVNPAIGKVTKREEEEMKVKVGDYVYALEDIKLYTSVEYKENKYTLKKGEKAYVRCTSGNNIALADPNTKVYFPSAWTNEFNKLTTEEPGKDYKKLYETEVEKNKVLQDKIDKAIKDLQG